MSIKANTTYTLDVYVQLLINWAVDPISLHIILFEHFVVSDANAQKASGLLGIVVYRKKNRPFCPAHYDWPNPHNARISTTSVQRELSNSGRFKHKPIVPTNS